MLILIVVIALVAWALRLMEQAVQSQEFSLMLAGFLVASSAAAMMTVYFLMGHYVSYVQAGQSVYQDRSVIQSKYDTAPQSLTADAFPAEWFSE
ncbi:MAG: hypothetical protein HC812_05205 [Leptolyngbya sp. RL_3_1]|nr:hypothetical protein [Leptolyngbya sp. RL_3_1]